MWLPMDTEEACITRMTLAKTKKNITMAFRIIASLLLQYDLVVMKGSGYNQPPKVHGVG